MKLENFLPLLQMEEVTDENLIVTASFESAINLLQSMENIETIWNIGGREIYGLGLKSPLLHQAIFYFLIARTQFHFSNTNYKLFYTSVKSYSLLSIHIHICKEVCSCILPEWKAIFRLMFSFLRLIMNVS